MNQGIPTMREIVVNETPYGGIKRNNETESFDSDREQGLIQNVHLQKALEDPPSKGWTEVKRRKKGKRVKSRKMFLVSM